MLDFDPATVDVIHSPVMRGLRVTLLSEAPAGHVEHPAGAALTPEQTATLFVCLNCHHLTHSPLAGEIPSLSCSAPQWHCHKQGQRARLRKLLKELVEGV